MPMTWREIRETDLLECLSIEPRHVGDEIVGRETAVAIWKDLIRSQSFNSCVIESASHPGRIVGFGASVFVTPEFARREIEDPQPQLNSRMIAGIAKGEPVIRPEGNLYNTSAAAPLDVVVLAGIWPDALLTPAQMAEVQMLLAFIFVELHRGYRLNRLFMENVSARQNSYHSSSGVWQTIAEFAGRERWMLALTPQTALTVSGSIAISLFQFEEPVLGFRHGEKHFLAEALSLRSDRELAAKMNLSLATVKKRWQALFERVADMQPSLLPVEDEGGSKLTRGPQKRHHILAYVRSHPQELRPYRWRSFKEA